MIFRQVKIIGIHFSFSLLSATIVYCYIFPIVCLSDQSVYYFIFKARNGNWTRINCLEGSYACRYTTRTSGREVPVIIIRKLFPYESLPILCCYVLQQWFTLPHHSCQNWTGISALKERCPRPVRRRSDILPNKNGSPFYFQAPTKETMLLLASYPFMFAYSIHNHTSTRAVIWWSCY